MTGHPPDRAADFRSDTVTVPTPRMRSAMAAAEVGDDFYGEDPTIRELQERTAAAVGTEAAVLVISGGMANLAAILALTSRGAVVLAEADSDLVRWEAHATSAVAGVQLTSLRGRRGLFTGADVAQEVTGDWRVPRPELVVIENTHCGGGGIPWRPAEVADVAAAGLPVLCDGARLFNAAVAGGYSPAEVSRHCAAVTVSLYKGLGAPMGSLVCGPAELVEQAARARRMLGGTLRQAGVIAAAGLVALEQVPRLADDHELARALHAGLAGLLPPESLPPPRTNIVLLHLGAAAPAFVAALAGSGVLVTEIIPGIVRFVTHRDVGRAEVARAIDAVGRVLSRRPMTTMRGGPR